MSTETLTTEQRRAPGTHQVPLAAPHAVRHLVWFAVCAWSRSSCPTSESRKAPKPSASRPACGSRTSFRPCVRPRAAGAGLGY
jgi:hypothetical protein